jgi:phenylacetate-CoA ligase
MRLSTLIRARLEHLRNGRRTRAEIEASQLKKFRRLVRYAAEKSPYYRDLVRGSGIDVDRCVPQDFPVLTKALLMENFDRIVTDQAITRARIADFLERSQDPYELFQGRYYVVHTSGTSGEVGYFVYSSDAWTRGVAGSFRGGVPGFRRHRLAFIGVIGGHHMGNLYLGAAGRPALRWLFDLKQFDINAPLASTLEQLTAFQPTILAGYASGLGVLAEQQLAGRLRINPRQIRNGAEVLDPVNRARLEKAFAAPVLDYYVSSEHHTMGLCRPEYGGMYLFEDDLIFEIYEDHTLVTNLFNDVMPLIRYRMNDVLAHVQDTTHALPFTKVELRGRSEQMPIFVNEHGEQDFISPATIIAFHVKHVRRFQLKVESPTACVFRLCLEPGLHDLQRRRTLAEVDRRFRDLLAQKEMSNVAYRIDVLDELPADPKTGKFRFVVVPEMIGTADRSLKKA